MFCLRPKGDEKEEVSPLNISYAEGVVDTAVANICATQRPKAQVLTRNGTWKERHEAEQLSKFLEGLLHLPQGGYENTWELCQEVATDAMVMEAGAVKSYPDLETGEIKRERVFSINTYVDPRDAYAGNPKTLYHRYPIDKGKLLKAFPEHAGSIRAAKLDPLDAEIAKDLSTADQCSLYEAWRLDGRHVIALDGVGNTVLVDEPYERDYYPILFFVWKRPRYGFYGVPLIDQCIEVQLQANKFTSYALKNAHANSGGWIDVPEDHGYDLDEIESNDTMKVITRAAGTAPGLEVKLPPLFSEQLLGLIDRFRSLTYELPGVSEMSTQGRKEQSITSGVAVRTVNALQTKRFAAQSWRYEQLFVGLARRDIDAVADLRDAGHKIETAIPSEGFLESVDWDEINLQTDRFEIVLAASSSEEDSIAAQKQTIQEYYEAGWLSKEAARTALSSPNPDVKNLSKRANAQQRYLDKLIGKFMMFDPEEQSRSDVWQSPKPQLNFIAAKKQMTDAMMEVWADDDRPPEQEQLFVDWLKELEALENDLAASAPPPAEQLEAMPPGMPPQGMPQGPQLAAV